MVDTFPHYAIASSVELLSVRVVPALCPTYVRSYTFILGFISPASLAGAVMFSMRFPLGAYVGDSNSHPVGQFRVATTTATQSAMEVHPLRMGPAR